MKTDEHISMYETLVKAQPEVLHYQNLLAGAYIQKVRESMDYSYLDRASQIVNNVIGAGAKNYEAARLRTEIALERHDFKTAAEYSLHADRMVAQRLLELGHARRRLHRNGRLR